MTDIDWVAIASLTIRVINAILWTVVCIRILKNDVAISRLARGMIISVLIFGMWVLVFGALSLFNIATEADQWIYTAFATYAGILALALLMDRKGP